MTVYKQKRNPFRIIILGFAGIILAGSLLLMLPISSISREWTSFTDSLFTSTSAICVTGLVVRDTASHWSAFGQGVILLLIQIGGLGIITITALLLMASGRKFSLFQRSTMKEAIAAPKLGGIVRLTRFIVKAALVFELTGALIMMPVFCKDYGPKGIWMALFHSISGFCNAGFDIMGTASKPFVSLTAYKGNPVICLTIPALIIIGGIGFLTWEDLWIHRLHWKHYRMQTKVILVTTALLLVLPAILFFFLEYAGIPTGERILSAFFQSATTRTAGFNTTDLNRFSGAGQALMIMLMLVGGSPGSTAGGMKTTTLAVLIGNARGVFHRQESGHFFGRRLEESTIKTASTILMVYIVLFVSAGLTISRIENLPLSSCLFETASAMGTVGLTLGITPFLHPASLYILIALMYMGRVGVLTCIYAALSRKSQSLSRLPQEKIMVG